MIPRVWAPPSPPSPADPGRLAAMCHALVLALRGPESAEPWGEDIADELLRATRRLGAADRERLQGMLDRVVDELNAGEADRSGESVAG